MAEEEKVVLLTQDAYDKLKEELTYREGEYRDEITQRIAAARAEGDLSENGGYQAAREEQGKNEGRINELIVKLRNAKIMERRTPAPWATAPSSPSTWVAVRWCMCSDRAISP